MTVGDWDRRQLCPDGACIGVIGTDGLCKTCGRAAQGWGDERKRGLEAVDEDDDLDEDEDYDDEDDDDHEDGDGYDDGDVDDDAIDPISPSAPAALGVLAEWADRQLCVDGACIGLIGDDGRCKVCDKPGSKAKPGAANSAATKAAVRERDDAALEQAAREMAGSAEPGEVESIAPVVALAGGIEVEVEDLEARKLCPDGGCVGVIGADGRCKVCGKEAA
jgi:hypothetical protein